VISVNLSFNKPTPDQRPSHAQREMPIHSWMGPEKAKLVRSAFYQVFNNFKEQIISDHNSFLEIILIELSQEAHS